MWGELAAASLDENADPRLGSLIEVYGGSVGLQHIALAAAAAAHGGATIEFAGSG